MADVERVDGLLAEMIGEAILTAAYQTHVQRDPAVAAGFGRLAAKHLDNVKRLAVEIAEALPPS